MNLEDLKIKDCLFFLELSEIRSIREMARRKNVQAGQISKIIKSIENKFEEKLFERTLSGVNLTPKGREVASHFRKLKSQFDQIEIGNASEKKSFLSIGSTSFLNVNLLPEVLSDLRKKNNAYKFRTIDLPPAQMTSAGLRSAFDICVHIEKIDWPKTWTSKLLGNMSWKLYCRKNHPVVKELSVENIIKYPFIYPVYWTQEGIKHGDDQFPITIKKRIRGDEVATAISAVEMVRNSDQLAFLPSLISNYASSKYLTELKIKSINSVKQPVYLTVRSDIVSNKDFELLSKLIKSRLNN